MNDNKDTENIVEYKNTVPENILKIQKKLVSYEVGSRNYKKYQKILAKHIKKHTMQKRVISHINSIEKLQELQELQNQQK